MNVTVGNGYIRYLLDRSWATRHQLN